MIYAKITKKPKRMPLEPNTYGPICCLLKKTASEIRELLRTYLDQRIAFYLKRDQYLRPVSPTLKLQDCRPRFGLAFCPQRTSAIAGDRPLGRRRHERRFEFAITYSGSLVEPHPRGSMVVDGIDRNLVQSAARLWRASKRRTLASCLADNRVNFFLAHRRHRQPARRIIPCFRIASFRCPKP